MSITNILKKLFLFLLLKNTSDKFVDRKMIKIWKAIKKV